MTTIDTLVPAYVGAALPPLLITRYSGLGLIDVVNTQDIADPIAAALVGCLALICAVPLTTGLAGVLVARGAGRRARSPSLSLTLAQDSASRNRRSAVAPCRAWRPSCVALMARLLVAELASISMGGCRR